MILCMVIFLRFAVCRTVHLCRLTKYWGNRKFAACKEPFTSTSQRMPNLPCPLLARALIYPGTYFLVRRMFLAGRGRRDRQLRAGNALVNKCVRRITGLTCNFAFALMLRPGASLVVREHLILPDRPMCLRYRGRMYKIECPPLAHVHVQVVASRGAREYWQPCSRTQA